MKKAFSLLVSALVFAMMLASCGGGGGGGGAATAPAAPSNLSAVATSSGSIDLAWTDGSDNEESFKIERSTDGATFAQVGTVTGNTLTYSDTGLDASTKYYYRVCASNSTADSAYSNIADATTQAPPAGAPAAPSNLTATTVSSTGINLAWTDNSNNETGFKIERGTDGMTFSQIGTVNAAVAAYSDTGLTSATTYYYRVRAYNAVGNSGYSNVANAATQASLPTEIRRVSVDSAGAETEGGAYDSSISSDGRYVAFDSSATNLVGGDTNGMNDIFVHDRQTGVTTRVSVDSSGLEANNHSDYPSISSDGRYVAFYSSATNLVGVDTNGMRDIFVHDRQTGATTRVSVDSAGVQADNNSRDSSISSDGRYVAFDSSATNLVGGDTNGQSDIFVHDRQTGATTRMSVDSVGTQAAGGGSYTSSISSDGRYVAFDSSATNLVGGDTNGQSDIFVHDRQTGATTRVSVDSGGAEANGWSDGPSISSDGRYVAFYSAASNLVTGDTNGDWDIFVHDRQTGATTRVSINAGGAQADDNSSVPSISGDGKYVAFESAATNLVSGDTNQNCDAFVAPNPPSKMPGASGSLDISFDNDGKVTTAIGGSNDDAGAVAIQTDGKIVVAGYTWNGTDRDFAVSRYNADGSLDTSFGNLGKVTTAIGTGDDIARAVAIRTDGRIVVAGSSYNGTNNDIVVSRYTTTGALDTSFDTDGIVTAAIGSDYDDAFAVAIQSDDKIVVAGSSWNGATYDIAVLRYYATGALDTSFDTDGIVTTAIGSGNDIARAVAIQTDGKIVVAGYFHNGVNNDIVVSRYTTTGALDATFGTGGKVTTAVGGGNDYARAVAIQSDGKIVAAGYFHNGVNDDIVVLRYTTTGGLDAAFDGDGIVTTAIGSSNDYARAVAIHGDGRIVVAGSSHNGANYDIAVTRYTTTGGLDAAFDTDGIATTAIGSGGEANAVAIQGDGKIVAAGSSFNGADTDFAVVRYWP